jgi:hypothetical protein
MGQICKEEIKRVNQCLSSSRNMHIAIENSQMQVPKKLCSVVVLFHLHTDLHKKLIATASDFTPKKGTHSSLILMLDGVCAHNTGNKPKPFSQLFL